MPIGNSSTGLALGPKQGKDEEANPFPQVVDSRQKRDAYAILRRDSGRICAYRARSGVGRDGIARHPVRPARDLWHKHIGPAAGEV
jgi:hypothetical protein